MFTNKLSNGRNNICGSVIERRRKELHKSQRQFADMLQLAGLDIDKNAVETYRNMLDKFSQNDYNRVISYEKNK